MNLRTALIIVLLALFAGFVALNWSVITAPTTLSFGFWTAQAPLGLLLLGFTVLIAAMFLFLLVIQQATVLVETRRAAKELTAQRALADQAEASRFTALGERLDQELRRLEAQAATRQDTLVQRLDGLEQSLRTHVDQASNSLAAFIGELDDRVERIEAARGSAPPPA
jgi:uncharacterized integral membrane protein/uncharacterized coiled-coil protein SlyX